jgi:hypothetical protein
MDEQVALLADAIAGARPLADDADWQMLNDAPPRA